MMEEPRQVDAGQAATYLREMGELWSESPRRLQREFIREVFAQIEVSRRDLVAITPKPAYAPLFVLDRQERFGGVVEMIKPPSWPARRPG